MTHALREALAGLRRTPLLAVLSVVAISLSLFVVGLFALTAFNVRRAIEEIESRVEVVAYLRDEATPQQVAELRRELSGLPAVASSKHLTKDEALTNAVQEMSDFREVFADLETNPLPASLEIRLRPGHRDPASVQRVADRLAAYPFVEEVRFGKDWVGKVVSLRRIAAGATTVIGGAFAAVAGIIIATAVRITVYARREEIEVMRLVGATDGFIRRPFLLEGLFAGLVGGLLAVLLTFGAARVVDSTLISVSFLPAAWALLGVGGGAIYGLVSSAVAVHRHLRAI